MDLLIVKTGSTLPEIASRRGDFEDWFIELSGVDESRVHVVRAHEGDPLPAPDSARGIIVTGSAAMVTARASWSERTGAWLREVVEERTPLLAVCYGHQLLADALGGEVGPNPRGREIGTVSVDLTEEARADPLFGVLPPRLTVQATHLEAVVRLPRDATRLGGNALDPHQVFRVGERAWGVQFHPELDAEIVRHYIAMRREACREEGLDPDALLAGATDSPHGAAVLTRFASLLEELSTF